MEKNVGKTDAIVRILVGIVALYLAWAYSPWWLIVAAIAIITALMRGCYLYKLLGMNTDKKVQVAKPAKVIKKAKKK